MVRITLASSLCFSLFFEVQGNGFLKQDRHMFSEHVSEQDIRTSLLDEVEGSLGKGSTGSRLSQIEANLTTIYAALPKNEFGNLGQAAVRYALHRLFVLRHGWIIKDLNSGVASNVSSSPGVLKDQVPAYIESLFEQRLEGKGFGLREVAVLAATIEHLIHNEAVNRLGSAFKLHGLTLTDAISQAQAETALDAYLMSFILGENLNNITVEESRDLIAEMPELFLAWNDTKNFVHDVHASLKGKESGVSFASLAKTVETVGEQFGSFQDLECQQMKDKLLKMEYRGTGRVKLADFYRPAIDGSWTFQESVGYLRALGLLDETDPDQPSVMIANYVTSHANCIAPSGFYSVCCKNECEKLLGHLEQKIGSHEATPAIIKSLVEDLPSSTVSLPHQTSPTLLKRLDEIALPHGGMVPLHSRLFAQWMHHVYPRECPYPHISGTTDSKLPDEYSEESGADVIATDEEMMQYVEQWHNASVSSVVDQAGEDLLPWSTEEELLVVRPQVPISAKPAHAQSLVLLCVASSIGYGLVQALKVTMNGEHTDIPQKYIV